MVKYEAAEESLWDSKTVYINHMAQYKKKEDPGCELTGPSTKQKLRN